MSLSLNQQCQSGEGSIFMLLIAATDYTSLPCILETDVDFQCGSV